MFRWFRRSVRQETQESLEAAEPDLAGGRWGSFLVRRFVQALVGSAFAAILFIAGLSALIQGGLAAIIHELGNNLPLAFLVFSAIFLGLFVTLSLIRGDRPDPAPLPPPDYEVEWLKIFMHYRSRSDIIYRRHFRIKVKASELTTFNDAFNWTGRDVVEISSSDEHHGVKIVDESGLYTRYVVSFNRVYRRNDVIDFTITWVLRDENRLAHPFVARVIERKYGLLQFTVELFSGGFPATARTEVALSPQDRGNAVHGEVTFSPQGVAVWKIEHPQMQRYHELRWSGPDWAAAINRVSP